MHNIAIQAEHAPAKSIPTIYPEPFASRMAGRTVQVLGDLFGLQNFGINRVTLAPGGMSALRHAHRLQDEFVYVLQGQPTLVTDEGETLLQPGMCAGFKAGTGNAHHLINRSTGNCVYLVVGDRTPGDSASYPDDDIVAQANDAGQWHFFHKDGRPY